MIKNVPSYHAPVWHGPGENAILFRGNQSLHGTQASAEEWNTRIFTMTVDAAFRGGGKTSLYTRVWRLANLHF